MILHKFNYNDLREMSLEEIMAKSNLYECDELLDTKLKNIPINERGIYFLISLTGNVLYIGKSENVRKRLRCHLKGHEKITREYIPFVSTVRVLYVDNEVGRQNLFSVERWFITQVKPIFNNN